MTSSKVDKDWEFYEKRVYPVSATILWTGILVCMIILVVQFGGFKNDLLSLGGSTSSQSSNSNIQTSAPSNSTWNQNKSDYCLYVKWLDNPQQYGQVSVFGATILANSAPSKAAHDASVTLYKDLSAGKPTQADIKNINSAYTCPSTTTSK